MQEMHHFSDEKEVQASKLEEFIKQKAFYSTSCLIKLFEQNTLIKSNILHTWTNKVCKVSNNESDTKLVETLQNA